MRLFHGVWRNANTASKKKKQDPLFSEFNELQNSMDAGEKKSNEKKLNKKF
jgi:hypothetical protein